MNFFIKVLTENLLHLSFHPQLGYGIQYIRSRTKKQDLNKINPEVSLEISQNPILFFKSMSFKHRQILNYFLFMSDHCAEVYVSQSHIAKLVGVSRQWVNTVIGRFEKLGLIATSYRHLKTSLYKVSSFFADFKIRSRLSCLFSALGLLSFIQLTQLYDNKFISNLNQSVSVQRVTTENRHSTKKIGEGKKVVEENPISEAIRNITSLTLSRAGQIRLSGFPDAAIKHADNVMSRHTAFVNPFGYFFKICQGYCKDRGMNPDWNKVDQLKAKYHIAEDAVMLLGEPKVNLPSAPAVKESRSVRSGERTGPGWDGYYRKRAIADEAYEIERQKARDFVWYPGVKKELYPNTPKGEKPTLINTDNPVRTAQQAKKEIYEIQNSLTEPRMEKVKELFGGQENFDTYVSRVIQNIASSVYEDEDNVWEEHE